MKRQTMYIYCIVHDDNSYDYETNGYWTDDLSVLEIWQRLGVKQVVKLDPLSYELLETFDNSELLDYIEHII